MRSASLFALLLLVRPPSTQAQPAPDSSAIRQAALDYIEGWYAGDGDRMARALHPELVKRIVNRDTLGNLRIRGMGATELVRAPAREAVPRRRRLDRLSAAGPLARSVGYSERALGDTKPSSVNMRHI